ncbi:MAG: sugar phosphorylase [Anaerolineae bacterium]|nr:sugar phosphorylase [Anaerolineae bacterium]
MAITLDDLRLRAMVRLRLLYGQARAEALWPRLAAMLAGYQPRPACWAPAGRVSERDAVLITYGDLLRRAGEPPLRTLQAMLRAYLADVISAVHILPFYPYSSDDGFSVIDYLQVDPALGDWEDVRRINADFRLMFDLVINHTSVHSAWFKGFLAGELPYRDFFITVDPATDLSAVTRPRTTPLLTPFQTARGEQYVWTTFSADQADLNFASEEVLLAMLQVLLEYVTRGANLIRLDAIAYLWKEIGTSCIHLPQTHAVVKLIRDVLDYMAPDVLIITETNVPHDENISYFGDGTDEAQLVYQFSLPPLVLHSFHTGSAVALTRWARTLRKASDTTTFFNFTASHDGIGVRPATGLLSEEEIAALLELTVARGGQVSYKTNSDGSRSPYELNVTYVDAIIDPAEPDPVQQARRFVASQAIMLACQGVPGIYLHSLLGSRNWTAGVALTGRARTINREKLDYETVERELADPRTLRHQVFHRYCDLLRIRAGQAAFHPNGAQEVLDLNPAVFAIRRTAPDGAARIVALHNVSGASQAVVLQSADLGGEGPAVLTDLVSRRSVHWEPAGIRLTLDAYQVMWLRVEREGATHLGHATLAPGPA